MQMGGAHQVRFPARELSLAGLRILLDEGLADHEAQNGITEEFELLVILVHAAASLRRPRAMRQRANQQLFIGESVAELVFQSCDWSVHRDDRYLAVFNFVAASFCCCANCFTAGGASFIANTLSAVLMASSYCLLSTYAFASRAFATEDSGLASIADL